MCNVGVAVAKSPADRTSPDIWTWFVAAVRLCYQRPESVVKRMTRYGATKGTDALLDRLAHDPGHFGRRIVFPPYGNKISQLPLRKEALQAAALLPLLARDAFDVLNSTAGERPASAQRDTNLAGQPRSMRPQVAADHVTALTT